MSATLPSLLAERAQDSSGTTFLRFEAGDVSFGEFRNRAMHVAGGLRRLGVGRSDLIAMLMPNCAEFVLVWFAVAQLGGAVAPVNTAFRGRVLAHVLELASPPC